MCKITESIEKSLSVVENIMMSALKETAIARASVQGSNDLFYIADIETHEIYFVNDKIKELFGEDLVGKSCFSMFHNSAIPCDFCNSKELLSNPGKDIIYPFFNQKVGKLFLVIDSLKEINGRKLKFERAIPISEHVSTINKIANKYNLYD